MSRTIALATALLMASSLPSLAQAEATATFVDVDGNEVGTATITALEEGGVMIGGELMGIEPGEHGFHVHETGDCDASTAFESAGGHFNPTDAQHGLANPEGAHAGDVVSNVTAAEDGKVTLEVTSEMISLDESAEGYLFDDDGSAMVLHADPDDQTTDPAGNAGDRIACAVIEAPPAS
jgi:Cu-Zn family superoxide dismutase